jgi:glycosyltransferase involved in cell wall biosynthesis
MVRPKPGPEERRTERPVRFAYIGRFEAIKGAELFARALTSLPDTAAFRAEFIGPQSSANDRSAVDRLRRLIGDDSRIAVREPVPHWRIPETLAGVDVLCCPSLAAEGGPTIAIEAHAVGTPVIGSRIGGLAELVTDDVNGRLVAAGDWRALADVIASIVADAENTVDRWRRALPRARTLDDVASDYLDLYAA